MTRTEVDLTQEVQGVLPAANGGTGQATLTGLALPNPTLTGPVLVPDASPTYAAGKMVFDSANNCITFFNSDSNVGLQIGQEDWIRVLNNSGASIANGVPVYINGYDATTGLPTIALASASTAATANAVGLTTETIATATVGCVTFMGVVHGVNTAAYTAGAALYLSTTAGALTSTVPSSPNFMLQVGNVLASNASTGMILVLPGIPFSGASGVSVVNANGAYALQGTSQVRDITTAAPGATPSINTDNQDQATFTGLAAAITSMTTNLTGTPLNGQKLMIRFTDNGTARAITWGAKFLSSGVATLLPTTVASKTHLVGLVYDSTKAAWICVAVDSIGY